MKNKSTIKLLTCLLFLSSFVFISGESKAQQRESDNAAVKLNNKIEQLEKKIENQQAEIENLRQEVDKLKKTRPWLAVPKIEKNDNFRKGRRFEFNGQVYYMVPLNSGNVNNDDNK